SARRRSSDLTELISMPRTKLRPLTLTAVLGLTVVAVVGAQAPNPAPVDPLTAKVVVQRPERGHMAKPKIENEIAKKWCKTFIKELDPQKNYFEKGDVDEFMAQATTLDDKIREGNIDFAREVFARYLKRSDERLVTVNELLDQKFDFGDEETIV